VAESAWDEQEPADEPAKIQQALRRTEGNVAQAARLLGWSRKALRYRMDRYGIERPSRQVAIPLSVSTPDAPLPQPFIPRQGQKQEAAEAQSFGMATSVQAAPAVEAPSWEQKPVAVLAIEVIWPVVAGSEALRYEPWTLATRWEQRIEEKVQGFGGIVLQRLPSLYLVAFGLPQTLEQLPQRAVQAALALRRLVAAARAAAAREPCPAVRQAIHWGLLLVDVQARDPTARLLAIGETLGLPVRLLGQAAPGEILVSDQMRGLVDRWYELQVCDGPVETGPSERLGAYRIISLNPPSSSLAQRGVRPLSRFVGRDREMATLHALLAQVENGHGHVVGIAGEPGIGKSRLLDEFSRSLTGRRLTYARGYCVSYGSATPYLPVLDLLRQHAGITEVDSPEGISAKVHRSLQELGMASHEWAPYLLQLLGVGAATDELTMLSPQALKARTIEALVQMSVNGSQQRPLVLEIEDLHWIDATSEEWLAVLVERVAGVPILVLTTYRHGYRPPWLDKSYTTQLSLQRLTPPDSARVVQAALHDEQVPEALAQEILARADGNPFFLEELTRIVVERDDRRRPLTVPDTIHAVLSARIDRLPATEKRLLQAAAVIGTGVPLAILQTIIELPEEALHLGLTRLQAAEFLYERGLFPDLAYSFKHALTHEVVYASLAGERRRLLHERTAQAIEALFHDRLSEHYGELAHHYSRSGNTEQAVDYLQRAGQQAVARSAHVEAMAYLSRGLQLLETMPETPTHRQQELVLQTTLGPALMAIKGFAAPEVEHTYARAWELCRQVGETPELFPVLLGLRRWYFVRAEMEKARQLGAQLLALAEATHDSARLLEAHRAVGTTLFFLGEFAPALTHLELGITLYEADRQHSHAIFYGLDAGVTCLAHAAHVLWALGHLDQARHRIEEGLSLARELAHPFSLAYALAHAAWLSQFCRQGHAVQAQAEELIALAQAHGFPHQAAQGLLWRGWALVELGRRDEGMAQMHQGLTAWRATGAELGRPYLLALLAEAHGQLGQAEKGLHVLDEAMAVAHEHGERFYEAELCRLKGELLLRQATAAGLRPVVPEEAEACCRQAVNIARRQGAKVLELRAVMSLSRLWRQQGKRAEARPLLAEIYGRFTEGFDSDDVQEAKRLLETID
jgi:predicted ATPase